MPGFRTHYLLGNETLSAINNSKAQHMINSHRHAFNAGLQGPDIFFYAFPSHIIHKENVGIILHKKSVLDFFINLIDARNSLITSDAKRIADAYILGFIGHYTLDTVTHPYVHYRTKKTLVTDERHLFASHLQLETDIDNLMLRHYCHMRIRDFSCAESIRLPRAERLIIGSVLCKAIRTTYPDIHFTKLEIAHALWSTRNLFLLLQDSTGIKKRLARRFDNKVFGYSYLSGLIAAEDHIYFKDPCNLKKRYWSNPWDSHMVSNENCYELFERAKGVYSQRIKLYCKHDLINLYKELSDCSYDSGLPIE